MDDIKNNRALLLGYIKLCALFQSHQWIQAGVTIRNIQFRSKLTIFCPMWLWKLMDDLEKQQDTSFMLFQTLSHASFCSHQSIQTVVIVWRWPILGQIWRFFLSCVTLKFDGSHWKTIGHLFCVTSSFVHHFLAIGQFKQSGNDKFRW